MTATRLTPDSNLDEPLGFDERTRRVLELRRLVREGAYRPDAGEVAAALLAEWQALGPEVLAHSSADLGNRAEFARRFTVERTAGEADEAAARSA